MINYIKIINHSDIKEDTHSPEQWDVLIEDLRRCIVQIPRWVYYHFLECVPPIYPKNNIGFFNSEPLTHNKEGQPIFYYFFKYKTNFYGCITSINTQEFCFQLAKESINSKSTNKLKVVV